jgi:solute carrier family 35 protein E1
MRFATAVFACWIVLLSCADGFGLKLFNRGPPMGQSVTPPSKSNNITSANSLPSSSAQLSSSDSGSSSTADDSTAVTDSLLPFDRDNDVPYPTAPGMSVAKTLRLGFYFFLWYFFTVVYNVSNKRVLNELPLPATLAAVQLVLGIPVFLPAWLIKRPSFEAVRKILPALGKIGYMHALGNLATVVSLHWGAVSFVHIIKAAEPAFAAALSAAILGSFFPSSVYLTLIPIIGGVAMASFKEVSFTWYGFVAGMASNLFYQLRIVLAKREFSADTNTLSPAQFFRVLTIVASLELLPLSLAIEGYKIRPTWRAAVESGVDMDSLVANILISSFSFYCYNEVSFWILGSIHPISHGTCTCTYGVWRERVRTPVCGWSPPHAQLARSMTPPHPHSTTTTTRTVPLPAPHAAVGNTIKRVVIIAASIFILKSPINAVGVAGSAVAVLGTLAYSVAQHFAADPRKKPAMAAF